MKATKYLLAGAGIVALAANAGLAQTAPAAPPPAAPAADASGGKGLEEIVVTATRTGETQAQKTPLAISVFSPDKVNQSRILNVKDLVAATPNLNVAQVTASAAIYIRGVGSNNVFAGSDPDVTVQSDGVYIARAFGQFTDFVDIQRIEVLRGPQGTLYGRNAIGGTINIISRLPTDTFQAKAQLTGGNYGLFQGQGYVSGPIVTDKLQASISGSYIRHNGYINNIVPGADNVDNANHGGLRGQLRFEPTDKIEMITRADWSKGNEVFDSYDHLLAPYAPGPKASALIGDYTKVAINSPQRMHRELWGVSEEINFHLTDELLLKSLSAYRRSKYALTADVDGTEANTLLSVQQEISRQWSQEFDLNYNTSRFQGVAGLYYFTDHDTSFIQSVNFPANALLQVTPVSDAKSVAAFAQGTYKITDQLSFTAGIRYTHDRKAVDQNYARGVYSTGVFGTPFTADVAKKFHAFTPKFGIDYQITPTVLAYFSATRGYKSGGTNYAAASLAALTFNPETIWAYEGGIKSEFLDHRLRLNVSAFKYDYKGLQVQSLLGPGLTAIGNATDATVKGLEFETTAKPIPNLLLTANYSLLRAHYGAFTNAAVPNALKPFVTGNPLYNPATATYDASGNRLNAAPRSSYFLSAQYDIPVGPGKAFLRGEYYHQSKVYYDPSNAAIFGQGAYHLVNASIGWNSRDSNWGIQFNAKNLTYSHYLITIGANGVVPAGLAGAPRTFSLTLTKSW